MAGRVGNKTWLRQQLQKVLQWDADAAEAMVEAVAASSSDEVRGSRLVDEQALRFDRFAQYRAYQSLLRKGRLSWVLCCLGGTASAVLSLDPQRHSVGRPALSFHSPQVDQLVEAYMGGNPTARQLVRQFCGPAGGTAAAAGAPPGMQMLQRGAPQQPGRGSGAAPSGSGQSAGGSRTGSGGGRGPPQTMELQPPAGKPKVSGAGRGAHSRCMHRVCTSPFCLL